MVDSRDLGLVGIERHVDIGLRLAPQREHAAAAAKGMAALLDAEPGVPVRLAGLGSDGSRVHLTFAISLGSLDDIKAASPTARAAVLLLQRIVETFAAYDPCLVELPDPQSPEAKRAADAAWQAPMARPRRGEGLLSRIG